MRLAALLLIGVMAYGRPAVGADLTPLDQQKAHAAYTLGERAYREGRFQDALDHFRSALQRSGRSALLHNIALCYDRLGDPARAYENFELYLKANPEDPGRAEIIRMMDELRLRARAIEEALRPAPPPTLVVRPTTPPPSATPPPARLTIAPSPAPQPVDRADAGAPARRAAWACLGLGLAAAAAAAGTGGAALVDRNTLEASCRDGLCPATLQPTEEHGHRLAIATDVLVGVAVVAAAGGIVAAVLARRARPRPAAMLWPIVGSGAVGLALELRR